ncbi:MAG: FkbM family methyltransferase [Lachnospiraceae bacterium]|nr:FkbM family methyltransferase [Lachnospiraceae bacterium]
MNIIEELLANETEETLREYIKIKYRGLLLEIETKAVYIFGTGRLGMYAYSQCTDHGYKIMGFIDNNSENWSNEARVFSPSILTVDDIVIVASFYYPDIIDQLDSINIKNNIYYEDLAIATGKLKSYYPAFDGIHNELIENKEKYISMYDFLEDDLSKEVFEKMVCYRMYLDKDYPIKAMFASMQNGIQYFDKVVTEKNIEFFYDVGGYDGDSTIDFIKQFRNYKKVFFYEPDKKIFEEAEKRFANIGEIECFQVAVGEKSEKLRYAPIGGGAGVIGDFGSDIIESIMLDDYLNSEKSYVKMDIEGYEMQAIRGMRNSILKYKPILAICVYHKTGDMHKLASKILSFNPNYKVYMRHYSKNYSETVCYFI